MSILVVDDSPTICRIIKLYLTGAGYTDLLFAESAQDAFQKLGIDSRGRVLGVITNIDLVLLDIILPDMDGRDVCRILKSVDYLQDIPVIIVTSLTEMEHLEKAFNAGAIDYITKPINNTELLARIRSALKLKHEMDRRKARELALIEVTRKLEQAVEKLNQLSSLDGLTGVANRRRFDEYINLEWARSRRNNRPMSLILADIDYFKAYNDMYGHQAGDECLKAVARTLQGVLNRPGDLVCRYGGEEFAAVLPETDSNGAIMIANTMCARVEAMGIIHESSPISNYITASLGVATILPTSGSAAELVSAADRALYEAKGGGRNRVKMADAGAAAPLAL